MSEKDRRVHSRVQVAAKVRVSGPLGVATGVLRDLSKGGAGVYLPNRVGDKGDVIELFLPFSGGIEIAVMAEILRSQETSRGILTGLKFNLVEPAMQEKLLSLIEALIKSKGSDSRKHARISRRFPIRYGRVAELRAMLENISLGGLAMSVEEPVSLYETIEVSVPDIKGNELLILKGRVVYQYPEKKGDKLEYRVGIEFGDLSLPVEACLRGLINELLEMDSKRE